MILNQIKTVFLLGTLTGVLLMIGAFFGGQTGIFAAFCFALLLNFGSYWFSDKLVLKMYRAKEAKVSENPRLYQIVKEVAKKAQIPIPKVYVVPTNNANAFATGRNPKHAVVAVTKGIQDLLSEKELKGVIAHEMAHIKHRDILIGSVAATVAGAISMVAFMARWAAIFGGFGRGRGSGNLFELIALAIVTPLIATIIRLAISRSREFLADEDGAKFLKDGKPLASALNKMKKNSKSHPMRFGSPAASHLFIVNPFSSRKIINLFSTHPSLEKRIKKLDEVRFN